MIEYDHYKKKYENSLSNHHVFNEKLKEIDKEVNENLINLDERLNRGFDRSIMMTS